VQAVSVDLERSEDKSFSWSVMVIGLSLSGFGFTVYYVMPLSLITMDLTLLLNIFFFILIGRRTYSHFVPRIVITLAFVSPLGMLLDLVLLSLNVEPLIERLIVNLFFFWEKIPIRLIIIKNLVAHRKRNTKTTIMYAISLGFIIFIMVSYNNVLDGFSYQSAQRGGVYLKVVAKGHDNDAPSALQWSNTIHKVETLESYLRNNSHIIKDHAWVSQSYDYTWEQHGGPDLENLGMYGIGLFSFTSLLLSLCSLLALQDDHQKTCFVLHLTQLHQHSVF